MVRLPMGVSIVPARNVNGLLTYGSEYCPGEEERLSKAPIGLATDIASRRHAAVVGVNDRDDEFL